MAFSLKIMIGKLNTVKKIVNLHFYQERSNVIYYNRVLQKIIIYEDGLFAEHLN